MLDATIRKSLAGFNLDVSLSVGDGMVAIFGPSGSGKSLTLQCIAGLLRPDAGRIAINGRTVFDSECGVNVRPQDRRIGYVFQDYALLPHLTVAENIVYGLNRVPRAERRHRLDKMLALMRLQGLEDRRPDHLSGGQQQRVALARALVTDPEILLLDEPFSALDSPIRGRLHAEVLSILSGLPITALLVTHDLAEAFTLSKTMAVYDAGGVLQIGPREEVLRRPSSRTVARFTATKNLFRGVVQAASEHDLEVRAGTLSVRTPAGPYAPGDVVDFCIRPEEIMLVRPDRAVGPAVEDNLCRGEVVGEIARGASFTLHFRLEGDPLGTGRDFDLVIEIPANVYDRLGVDSNKRWTASLKKESIHIIGRAPARPSSDD
ncbi:MAG TPA: ABC transporter ATP-binding protein [Chloroflexota bacterium]